MLKRVLLPLITSLLLLSTASASEEPNPRVRLSTSQGDIVIELDRAKAPKSVANFLSYVESGYYDGTIFHRIIRGFMNQGGGFSADFQKKPTRAPIANEADNGLKNERGTLAMARTPDPHSATSQFFINTTNNTFLNFTGRNARGWGYAVFGRVVAGMDVVDRMANTPTGPGGPFPRDVPRQTIMIEKATLEAALKETAS